MAKHCPYCGNQVGADWNYCQCGRKLPYPFSTKSQSNVASHPRQSDNVHNSSIPIATSSVPFDQEAFIAYMTKDILEKLASANAAAEQVPPASKPAPSISEEPVAPAASTANPGPRRKRTRGRHQTPVYSKRREPRSTLHQVEHPIGTTFTPAYRGVKELHAYLDAHPEHNERLAKAGSKDTAAAISSSMKEKGFAAAISGSSVNPAQTSVGTASSDVSADIWTQECPGSLRHLW